MTTLPTVGMEFDSVDEAWQFWVEYGRKTGFGVRKQYFNKRKEDKSIRSCRFVCCKEGHRKVDKRSFMVKNPRAETRTGCNARISLSEKNGKFVIQEFVEDHNHCLQLAETTHMLASHRKISEVQAYEIEMAEDCGLMQKANFQLMSAYSGGRTHLGYTRLDAKNYLKSRRQRCMVYGEAGSLMAYFQHQQLENPSFYHEGDEGDDPIVTKEYVTQAKGFKKRNGLKTTKRLKSWNELQPKRKRKPPAKKPSPCEGFEDDVSLSQIDCGTSILEHQIHEFSQPSENQFSYTRLLMEPLSDE